MFCFLRETKVIFNNSGKFFRDKKLLDVLTAKMSNDTTHRVEKDSFGDILVPADKYYGANTARSLIHFNIGGPNERMPVKFKLINKINE